MRALAGPAFEEQQALAEDEAVEQERLRVGFLRRQARGAIEMPDIPQPGDIDARHGGDKSLATLEAKYGPLPVTPSVRSIDEETGKEMDVKHLYFQGDPRLIDCELVSGLEIIAGPKYIVAPPSLHSGGTRNRWAVKPTLAGNLAPMPAWVFEEIAKTPAPRHEKKDLAW